MHWFSTTTEAVNIAFYVGLGVAVSMVALVTALMVVFVVKYRRGRHPKAAQIEGYTPLEIAWTVIPTLIALAMFFIGWSGFKFMRHAPKNAMKVTATARMWSWEFTYANGKKSSELVVPKGVPIEVDLKSLDVIHGFYIPAYRVKQDAVPGGHSWTWFQPVDTGRFDIFCTQYCGQRHSYMMSKVVVMPKPDFENWIAKDVQAVAPAAPGETADELQAQLRREGEHLYKLDGCNACHSTDGSRLVGPTFKGVFGRTETVVTNGKTRQIVVDEDYVRRSIREPTADVVQGFQPVMPKLEITDDEINAIIAYLKSL